MHGSRPTGPGRRPRDQPPRDKPDGVLATGHWGPPRRLLSFAGRAFWGFTKRYRGLMVQTRFQSKEPSCVPRPLRTHQARVAAIVQAVAAGEAEGIADILAAVTPGGGKSLLPVIAAAALIRAGVADRVCWVVPRDSLRLQAEEAFADPAWRTALGHALSVRAAGNEPDPCRGLAGYVTTYQGVAAAPDLHLAEFSRHRYLLVVDEVHHLPPCPTPRRTRWPNPAPPRRPAGAAPCNPCWKRPACGSCCPARWSARTAAASCGCPTAPARAPPRGRWTCKRRAGPSSATAAPRPWRSARCCPSCSARWTARRAG